MTLAVTFVLTLDTQYTAGLRRQCGLLGKKANQLHTVDGNPIAITTSIESIDGSDYRGDSVAGKKGDRFVYFGLEQDGNWVRRWKLRHHQLDDIFNGDATAALSVHVYLDKEVTPKISLATDGA